jgi:hypothetical protein
MEEWKKIARLGSIFIINIIFKELIDWLLNPILMIELGYWLSTLITTIIYLIIGFATVRMYDSKKIDSFGFESSKYTRDEWDSKKNLGQLVMQIFRTGFLFYLKNAGLFVIYFRKGPYLYNGFTDKNMRRFFVIYLIFINILWNILVLLGISVFKVIFAFLK